LRDGSTLRRGRERQENSPDDKSGPAFGERTRSSPWNYPRKEKAEEIEWTLQNAGVKTVERSKKKRVTLAYEKFSGKKGKAKTGTPTESRRETRNEASWKEKWTLKQNDEILGRKEEKGDSRKSGKPMRRKSRGKVGCIQETKHSNWL